MDFETVIGLEVHCELSTETKIFCSCKTSFGEEPNTNICPVCTGFPGVLPVLNKKVLEYSIKAGLALNCEIAETIVFDRKNYFYPDLPKAYQISQLYAPLCREGYININTEKGDKKIRIREIHMEEDAGKLIHSSEDERTLIDYNRAGVPLIEIVTYPDFSCADEVLDFLAKLKAILLFTGVSDCKMQEGSLRVDVNLSVKEKDAQSLGERTETKNLNSFKAVK
ncbi:MAG: Asp-tRNA(Asn)/Glu-tRNA(Gln) amidotransferase subunit GatB, partial [Firmicutes bacterium]|nr:Asp-tRNA(Asn)/Glu-tRNA(Gln) amidotransferase subunit GatB [Bacillota bacterium]